MKKINLFLKSTGILFCSIILAVESVFAVDPAYLCELRNDYICDPKVFEFDVYLLNTNPAIEFQLASIQFGININAGARNGGTITVSPVPGTSQLNGPQQPTQAKFSFNVTKNCIIMTAMANPGVGYGTIISTTSPGTRVVRVRLTNTVDFGQVQPNLSWCFSVSVCGYPSKVNAYVGGLAKEITNQASHTTNNLFNLVMNLAPVAFNVTGTGNYCQGGGGLPVGLSGSEEGVTYQLYKDGIAQGVYLTGTGGALDFGYYLSGTYTIEAVRNGTCTSAFMNGNAKITEDLPLPVSVSIVASENPVCEGTSVTYTATPFYGGTPYYQWYKNGIPVGLNQATYTDAALINGETIHVIMTSSLTTCVTGNPATSNTITMVVTPVFNVSVSVAPNGNPVCEGTPVIFVATPTNGGNPYYQWYKNGVPVGLNQDNYTLPVVNGDQVYVVMTSDVAGCLIGNPATSNTVTMTVNPILPVSVSIVASEDSVCPATPVTFTATPVNGGAAIYAWYVNSVLQVGEILSTFTYTPADNDQVFAVVTSSLTTCVTGSPATSNTITMSVTTTPTSPDADTHITSQTLIIWNWNAVPGVTGYKWNTTNNYGTAIDIGIDTSKTETGLSCETQYSRFVWAYNACGASTALNMIQTTSSCIFNCGALLPIIHVAGTIAPVTKTVTYGTVTNIPGETSKCWITSNLGADHQAMAVTDATEASAGWYWQFNHKQGFKHDGTVRTPNTTWITNINETSNWIPVNDPCTMEIGNGWRIPTSSEWTNVDASGGWMNWNGPWNSELKMHAGGILDLSGSIYGRGTVGHEWSNMQNDNTNGWSLYFDNVNCFINLNNKSYGFSLRCIKENTPFSPTSQASNITFSNITPSQIAFNWTDGNGAKRAVFIKQDSTGTAVPVDNISYNASTSYGAGSQIGSSGWYCIFNDTLHPSGVTVTNLQPNTNYRVMVFEYNGNPGSEKYNTTSATNNPLAQKTTYTKLLNLKLFLEGLYVGGGWMYPAMDENGPHWGPSIADKINIELHSSTNYSTIYYTLDNCTLNSNGTLVAEVPSFFNGSYYITIKHRNSIETTTSTPVSLMGSAPVTYNFTTAAAQAYGDNQKEIYGKWAIWGGDANQDGIIDGGDMNGVDNATTAVTFGYVAEDANGDGVVDAGDMNIIDNNTTALIMAVIPDTCPVPQTPTDGTHVPSSTQIIWNWNTISGAIGYKWSTTNDYASATDLGNFPSKTETGLTCNTAYTCYAWAYSSCGFSTALTMWTRRLN